MINAIRTDSHSNQNTLLFLLTVILFFVFVWIRFSSMTVWGNLGWDQVHTAWMSARILHDHQFPMQSMMVKGNSGIHIGPLYYYLVVVFYWMTNYDPIASPLLAASTGVIGFIVLFWCVNKIHGQLAAVISVFLLTFSGASILADRVQWSPNLIPPISLLLFYNIYRVIQGNPRNLVWVGLLIGLAFHIHFIVLLFIGMVLASVPFFPRKKQTIFYALLGIGIVLVLLIPNFWYEISHPDNSGVGRASSYMISNYHGFHGRRFLQLTRDAFIDMEKILPFRFIGRGIYLIPFLYMAIIRHFKKRKKELLLPALVGIWLVVPWFVFSLYSGEISDYYFSSFRYIAIMMIAYILFILIKNNFVLKLIVIAFLFYYAAYSRGIYMTPTYGNLSSTTEHVKETVTNGTMIPFVEGSLQSYLYFIYTELKPITRR